MTFMLSKTTCLLYLTTLTRTMIPLPLNNCPENTIEVYRECMTLKVPIQRALTCLICLTYSKVVPY